VVAENAKLLANPLARLRVVLLTNNAKNAKANLIDLKSYFFLTFA